MDGGRSTEERIGVALSRGDMRQRRTLCDLDQIGALGMVGVEELLADAVFRLKYALDPKSYDDALVGVHHLARALNARHHWRLSGKRLQRLAESVMRYWIDDTCPSCTGIGFEPQPGTARLSDRVCRACMGERKRRMPWQRRIPLPPEGRARTRESIARWRKLRTRMLRHQEQHHTLLAELEACERRIAEKVRRKLGL